MFNLTIHLKQTLKEGLNRAMDTKTLLNYSGFFYQHLAMPSVSVHRFYCSGAASVPNPQDGTTGDVCPRAHYCPEGSPAPVQCDHGTFTTVEQTILCNNCTPGHYCTDGDTPVDCPEGYYCPEGTGWCIGFTSQDL